MNESHNDLFPSLFSNFLSPIFVSDWKNELFKEKEINVKVLRLDAEHQHIGGNKLYKLYYNLIEAKKQKRTKILTFGGAYSNHLRAIAFATKELEMKSIAIIRGEEHKELNPVLAFCKQQNMQLQYISRTQYREKNNPDFIEKLKKQFGDFYLVPEGGSNALAIKGTSHIPQIAHNLSKQKIDYFALALGTGGTTAGILNGIESSNNQNLESKVLAISALKGGHFLKNDIENLLNQFYNNNTEKTKKVISKLLLETNFHEGGYAKKSERLINFINQFNQQNDFQIEPIYTGKAFFAVYNLIKSNFFEKGQTIMLVHTGGII